MTDVRMFRLPELASLVHRPIARSFLSRGPQSAFVDSLSIGGPLRYYGKTL